MPTTMTAPRRLRKIRVSEISLVDVPANQHATVELMKRHAGVPAADRGQALLTAARRRADVLRSQRQPPSTISKADATDTMAAGRNRAMAILKGARTDLGDAAMQGTISIAKVGTDDERYIAGWASVIAVGGVPVVDRQGDQIDEADLREAAHDFLDGDRQGLVMHRGNAALTVCESLVLTPTIAKAMGVTSDRTGWWVGCKIHDDDAWLQVKAGTLRSLSIAGTAVATDAEG